MEVRRIYTPKNEETIPLVLISSKTRARKTVKIVARVKKVDVLRLSNVCSSLYMVNIDSFGPMNSSFFLSIQRALNIVLY